MSAKLIAINGNIYDITYYIDKHEGNGINNSYLINYTNKEATKVFIKNHFTDKAYDILNKVKKEGTDSKTKINYVCPNFFKEDIPDYFYYNPKDIYATKHMENKPNNYFVLRTIILDNSNCLYLTYKSNNIIKNIKIQKKIGGWEMLWYIGEYREKINDVSIELIIQKLISEKNIFYKI